MLYIHTLGEFDIKREGESILNSINYPYRLAVLYKYLLTFHDKKLMPESIIEDLSDGNDFQNPKAVLRTQISRLRKLIKIVHLEECFDIKFSHGFYIFSINDEKCILDTVLFEEKIVLGNSLREENPSMAVESYLKVIEIYNGKYLKEIEYENWITPLRNKYERMYLQSLFRLIEILDIQKKYDTIVEVCERAIEIQPYNENLNIYFIEALLNIGESKYAFSHYEYITSKLYRELDVVPSDNLKRLYKKMISKSNTKEDIEIPHIPVQFKDEYNGEGAFKCESDYFSFLYNLEKRRNVRDTNGKKFIGIITIFSNDEELSKVDFPKAMKTLEETVYYSLRKGDVFTLWNERQILFLLTDIEYKNVNTVKGRIIKNFNMANTVEDYLLKIKIGQIK